MIDGGAELEVAEVVARAAVPLHGAEDRHHPGPLHAHRAAAGAADAGPPAARAEVGLLRTPLARQGADVARRHAGLGLLPLGRLRDAVALTQDVRLPLVKARGPLGHESLVIQPFGYPDVADRLRERGVGLRSRRDPLAAEVRRGVVQVGVDVDHFDAELPGPLAPLGPLEAVGRVRVRGPEDDHLGVLEAVLHGAVELRAPEAGTVAPVVHRAPEPALPAVGAVHELGDANEVPEAVEGAQVVPEVAPLVVRAVVHRDRTRAHRPGTLDLRRDDVGCLVPGDALELRDPAILGVALAVRVEVDPLHRVKEPVLRVHHGLLTGAVRGQCHPSRRRELLAARLDGPAPSVLVLEVHRSGADDLAVLDVDEERAAVGAVGVAGDAVTHVGSGFPGDRLQPTQGAQEPDREVIRTVDEDLEVLRRVDALEQVEGWHEKALRERPVLEGDGDVGARVDAAPGADLALVELDPATLLRFVPQLELGNEIPLLQARGVLGVDARSHPHRLRNGPQQERQVHGILLR